MFDVCRETKLMALIYTWEDGEEENSSHVRALRFQGLAELQSVIVCLFPRWKPCLHLKTMGRTWHP